MSVDLKGGIAMQYEQLTESYISCLNEAENLIEKQLVLYDRLMTTLVEANNNRQQFFNFANGDIESFLIEARAAIIKLEEKNIKPQFEFIKPLSNEYFRISEQNAHPEKIRIEMLSYLNSTSKQLRDFLKRMDFSERIISLEPQLRALFQTEAYYQCIDNIREFHYTTLGCQDVFFKMLHCLMSLIEYFSIPTECPPHM